MDRLAAVALFCSFVVFVWGFELFGSHERKLTIKKLENCKTAKSWPMSWQDFRVNFKQATKQHIMNLKLVVKEEVSQQFWMSFSFLKCDTSGNPDSCEYLFRDQKIENICRYVSMKDQSWSQFIECFDKEFKCPLKPDTYRLKDLIINSSSLNKLPVKDAVWKLNIGGYDKGKKISCADVEIQILTVRGQKT